MDTQVASTAPGVRTHRSPRATAVLALGPLTVVAGLVWAVVQPYRVTLLHPHGHDFWWLFVQPPLYVVLVGILFRLVVAPGLVRDLEEHRAR
jgi:hypothetical protein